MLTEKQILKLRPEFEIGGGMSMVEWFEIRGGAGYFSIRSGLNHADGVTKSPFFFECTLGGKNAKKKCLEKFNQWWENVRFNK